MEMSLSNYVHLLTMEALDQLLAVINDGVADIKLAYATASQPFPNLDQPYSGPNGLETAVAPATARVVAAANQLLATIRIPSRSVLDSTMGVRKSRVFQGPMC
jgi:hypothetical protein